MNFFRSLFFGSPNKAAPANRTGPTSERGRGLTNNDANTITNAAQRPTSFIYNDSHRAAPAPTEPSESIIPVANTLPALLNNPTPIVEDEIFLDSQPANDARVIPAAEPGIVAAIGAGAPNTAHANTANVAAVLNSGAQANIDHRKENVHGDSDIEGEREGEPELVEPRVLYERINNQGLPEGEAYEFLKSCVRRRPQRRSGPANPNSIFHRPSSARLIEKRPPASYASLGRHSSRHRPSTRRASTSLFSLPFQRVSIAGPSQSISAEPVHPVAEGAALPLPEDVDRPSPATLGHPSSRNFNRPSSMNFGRPSSVNFGRPHSTNFGRPSSINFGRPLSGNFSRPVSTNHGAHPLSIDRGRPSSFRQGRLSSFNRATPFVNGYERPSLDRSPRRPLSLRASPRPPHSSLYYRSSYGPSDARYYDRRSRFPSGAPVVDSENEDGFDYSALLDPATLARRKELEDKQREREEKLDQWRKRPRVRLVPPNIPPEKRRRIAGSFSKSADAEVSEPANGPSNAPPTNFKNQGVFGEPSRPLASANADSPPPGKESASRFKLFSDVAPCRAPDGTPLMTTQRKIIIPDDLDKRPKFIAYGCGERRKSVSRAPVGSAEVVKNESGKRSLDNGGEDVPDLGRARKIPRVSSAPAADHVQKGTVSKSESPSTKNLWEVPKSDSDVKVINDDGGQASILPATEPAEKFGDQSEAPPSFPPEPSRRRVTFSNVPDDAGTDDMTKSPVKGDIDPSKKPENDNGSEQRPERASDEEVEVDLDGNEEELSHPDASFELSNYRRRRWSRKLKSSVPRSGTSPDPPPTSNSYVENGQESDPPSKVNSQLENGVTVVDDKDNPRHVHASDEETLKGDTVESGEKGGTGDAHKPFDGQPFSFPSTTGQFTYGESSGFGASGVKNGLGNPSDIAKIGPSANTIESKDGEEKRTESLPLFGTQASSNTKDDNHGPSGPLAADTYSVGGAAPQGTSEYAVEASDGKSSFLNGTEATVSKDNTKLNRNNEGITDNGAENPGLVAPQPKQSNPLALDSNTLCKDVDSKERVTESVIASKSAEVADVQRESHASASSLVLFDGLSATSGPGFGTQGSDGRGTSVDITEKRSLLQEEGRPNVKEKSILEPEMVNEEEGDPMGSPTALTNTNPPITGNAKLPFSFGGNASGPAFGTPSLPTNESANATQSVFKFSSTSDNKSASLTGGPFSGPGFMAQSSPDNLSTFVFGAAPKATAGPKLPTPSFGSSDLKPSSSPIFMFGGSSAATVSKELSSGPAATPLFGSSGTSIFNNATPGFSTTNVPPFGKSDASAGPAASGVGNAGSSAFSTPASGALFGAPSTPFGAGVPSLGSGSALGKIPSFGVGPSMFGNSSSGAAMSSSALPLSTPTSEAPFGTSAALSSSVPSFASGSAFGTTSAFGSGLNTSMTPIFGSTTPAFGGLAPAFGSSSAPVFGGGGSSFGTNLNNLGANPGSYPVGPIFGGFSSNNATTPSTGLPASAAPPSAGQLGPINFNPASTAASSNFSIGSTQTTGGNTSRRRIFRAKRMNR